MQHWADQRLSPAQTSAAARAPAAMVAVLAARRAATVAAPALVQLTVGALAMAAARAWPVPTAAAAQATAAAPARPAAMARPAAGTADRARTGARPRAAEIWAPSGTARTDGMAAAKALAWFQVRRPPPSFVSLSLEVGSVPGAAGHRSQA